MENIPVNELKCPNCGSNDIALESCEYTCRICLTQYQIQDGIHIFLPKELEENKVAEEKYRTSGRGYELSHRLLQRPEEVFTFQRRDILRFKQTLSRLERYDRILELGAGSCWASVMLKTRNANATLYSSDISITNLRIGRSLAAKTGLDRQFFFVAGDAENLPFADGIFDAVFSYAMVHHTPHPERLFNETWRVLKRGGIYLGCGEGAVPSVFKGIYRMIQHLDPDYRHGAKVGVLENIWEHDEWVSLISRELWEIEIIPNKSTPMASKLATLYTNFTKIIPDRFLLSYLPCSIIWRLRKRS